MAACDFFILNSTHEGLPHVVLEAMALGLPVVATAVGGIPEVVRDGETGVLVSPEDRMLESTLLTLVSNKEMKQQLGERAQRWIRENMSLEAMVVLTEQVLKSKKETMRVL
jgi:Glycosyltransferase